MQKNDKSIQRHKKAQPRNSLPVSTLSVRFSCSESTSTNAQRVRKGATTSFFAMEMQPLSDAKAREEACG
eukprot:936766-Pleurochrysis_carterae.AAC.1